MFTWLFGDLLAFVYHCFDRVVIHGSDLKELRKKKIIQRIGQTRRYESMPIGLRAMAALVVLRNKAIKPLLAVAQERRP